MTFAHFELARLRIMWRGQAVYDQNFHSGVNIIRGLNSSGKSTISDFIFYALGGELESWKGHAEVCEEVQAEIKTLSGPLTVRRPVGSKITPPFVFFGSMTDAFKQPLDGWISFPLHRAGSQESFSQILFRASGIPEAPSSGSSNITSHQILRLLYADQRTPAGKLFRFESFDTSDIREAVGDLVCGLNVHEAYGIRLRLRELDKIFKEKEYEFSLKSAAMPKHLVGINFDSLQSEISRQNEIQTQALREIENVDALLPETSEKQFLNDRHTATQGLTKSSKAIRGIELQLEKLELEVSDLHRYIDFLSDLLGKLQGAETSAAIVGELEFTHCPSCLSKISGHPEKDHCAVCGNPKDTDAEKSRYLHIRIDFEIQVRESQQLLADKEKETEQLRMAHRRLKQQYDAALSEFTAKYEASSSPRESFLAERNQSLGKANQVIGYLNNLIDIATDITRLGEEKAALNLEIQRLAERLAALSGAGEKRKSRALSQISSIGCELLKRDLPRQEEFLNPSSLRLNFRDDAIALDGRMNFSESSNVILKNTAILSLFAAAASDENFYHPRFLLMDNIEDKGMEEVRSHNFQALIVEVSRKIDAPHQIIFTTSMMNTNLDVAEFTIGPAYTRENRTLVFPSDPLASLSA